MMTAFPVRRRALLAALLASGGCSVLPSRPYIETRRFALTPTRTAPPRRGRGQKVLLVRLTRAAPGLDQRGLRTRRADGTEDVDFYNEWVAPPAELVEEALRRWLTASGLFSAVTVPGSRAPSDLVLETELTALQAIPSRGVARAAFSALLLSEPGRGTPPRVVAQLTPSGEAPLPVDSRGEATPEAAATAMTEALANALAALEGSLSRHA
jgi:ABC-type uncharacterized transport system auxiliary subunit